MIKYPTANAGDAGSVPGSGRFPGEGNGNPLCYSCLENSVDRGAWWATVHGDTTEQLTHTHTLHLVFLLQHFWYSTIQITFLRHEKTLSH